MSLKDFEIDALLAEDPTLVKRCAGGSGGVGVAGLAADAVGCWVPLGWAVALAQLPVSAWGRSAAAYRPLPTIHASTCRRNAAQQAAKDLNEAQGEVKRVQEVRAGSGPRAGETAEISVRSLLLAGAFPLIPPEKVPKSVRNPGALYGEFTPVTLLQGVGEAGQAAMALGTAALKAVGRALGVGGEAGADGSGTPTAAAAAENGPRSGSGDGGGARPASAGPPAPSPTAAAASAAAKPRRQPPPPPPKIG